MGLLNAIYRGTHTRVSPTGPIPPVLPVDPATGQPIAPATVPAPDAVAPAPVAGPPPTAPVNAHPSIMSAIGGILAPEPGSFWDETMQNGVFGARRGMQDYANQQQDIAEKRRANITNEASGELKNASDTVALSTAKEDAKYHDTAVGGQIVRRLPDGSYETVVAPPDPAPTEVQRLIEQWKTATGPLKALIERAIKGYNYSPEYIQEAGDAKTRTAVAAKKAQKFAPRAGGKTIAPPAGFQ